MLFVVCCVLVVACCMLFVMCRVLLVVCCLLSDAWGLYFVVVRYVLLFAAA